MTFAELQTGQTFHDIFINEKHTKVKPQPFVSDKDKRRECAECHTPAATFLNARAADGSLVHICPTETVLTERVKVEA
jgi:hypothetical protein